jgi:ABC-type cobalamin/Fe3+-siderophores transport system ATPase subunit
MFSQSLAPIAFNLSIPRNNGSALELTMTPSEVAFLLGANGTGKSSLLHRFYTINHSHARRITAHRQTWFESNAITLSPQQKQQTEINIRAQDTSPQARWKEYDSSSRASMAIYDLLDAENIRAREITDAVDRDDIDLAKELRKKDAPIKIINELLRLSSIPVAIRIQENAQIVASKNGGATYSIAELSDGERNALLIAGHVLTAKGNSLILIDEPERHLHRSVISPLLTQLFAKRPDCGFVVSTHDVMLPLDNPMARTILIRGCAYNGSAVTGWDADVVDSASGLDDDLKRDILGARRRILFVEGTDNSLDKPLYSLIFPGVSVIAKGSCRDVERAVVSIRDAEELHWLDAFGLIDNDHRPEPEINELREHGIYATVVYSVEGVYYHPDLQRRVAERHARTTGADFNRLVAEANSAAIVAIDGQFQRLSERIAEKLVREEFFSHIPSKSEVTTSGPISISIDAPKIIGEERVLLRKALDTGDLPTLMSRYPVRETPALNMIARKLGFQDRGQYESAVRKLLMDEEDPLTFVRSLFGTLAVDILSGGIICERATGEPAPLAGMT